jgi:hypothetical protein
MTAKNTRNAVIVTFAFLAIATASLAAQAKSDQATVTIDNRNTLEVVVYAVTAEGTRYRLGSVHRKSTADLTLPAQLVDGATPFRIKVSTYERGPYSPIPIARDAVKTQPMVASAGETIVFLVQARLTDSHIISP